MQPTTPQPREPRRNVAEQRLAQIMDPATPLHKEDVVWILDLVKKKVTESDPAIMDLTQPRLLQNFRYFAEIALMLIHRRSALDWEAERLKEWIYEATYGLHPSSEAQDESPTDLNPSS